MQHHFLGDVPAHQRANGVEVVCLCIIYRPLVIIVIVVVAVRVVEVGAVLGVIVVVVPADRPVEVQVADGIVAQPQQVIARIQAPRHDKAADVAAGGYHVRLRGRPARQIARSALEYALFDQLFGDKAALVRLQNTFVDQRFERRARKAAAQLCKLFHAHLKRAARLSRVQFEDLRARGAVGQADLYLFVDPAGADERGGQLGVVVAGRHKDKVFVAVHAVDQGQQLREDGLRVVGVIFFARIRQHLVHLVKKDHGRLARSARAFKRLLDFFQKRVSVRRAAEVDLDHLQVAGARHHFGEQRLSRPRAPVKDHALGQLCAARKVLLAVVDDVAKPLQFRLFLRVSRDVRKLVIHVSTSVKRSCISILYDGGRICNTAIFKVFLTPVLRVRSCKYA